MLLAYIVCTIAPQVHATADTPRYECSAPSPAIVFRPTMMFQTRSFTFTLTNSALTALDYSWQILGVQGEPDTTGQHSNVRGCASRVCGSIGDACLADTRF